MSALGTWLAEHASRVVARWDEALGGARSGLREASISPSGLLGGVADALARGTSMSRHWLGTAPLAVARAVRELGLLRSAVLELAERDGLAPSVADVRILAERFDELIVEALARVHGDGSAQAEARQARERADVLAEEVRVRDAQLALVTDALPFLVSFVSADERYLYVNRTYTAWFGQPRETYVGKTLREVIGEGAYAQMGPLVRRALSGEKLSIEQYGVPYPGRVRDVRVTFVPQRASSGAIDGYVALLEDISARRALEHERERLSESRAEVLESMSDAFFALDASWRITLVNRFFEERAGATRDALVGKVLWDVLPQDGEAATRSSAHYRRSMAQRVPISFVEHDPTTDRFTDVRVAPTSDGGIAAFLRDVTIERRAEALKRRQGEFEQQLIGIVSHDLRNPLNVILLSSSRMARSENLGEGNLKNCMRIQTAAERATRMVRDLLDFTQARVGGGIQIEPRSCDLAQVVSTVVDEVEAAYPERMLDLVHEGTVRGHWDAERLVQVVQNLLTNALKYSPESSIVSVRIGREAGRASLTIHNTGPSIPEAKLPSLFEPMQRAVSGVDRATRSVGLGLYIVKHIVEAHGGTVQVRSSDADGTTFTVRLP
ncbi:MAG: PAS domain-containing sensor histidine kinase [Polyangiales bacterium]